MYLPGVSEQRSIIDYITERCNKEDQIIDRAHREITLLREYHTRLITDIITGKLDVCEAAKDLPDEPNDALESLDENDALSNAEEAPDEDFDAVAEESEI